MGKKQTADGRWIIGGGENSTDYKGFLHWRECYICLTESGATEESVNYLNALKEYALAHYALGEPIMPPSMTVWVVANGKAVAVQAGDVKIEGGDYTICGITYSDGAWDYSNAGKGGGGSSLPAVTAEDNGDVLTVVDGEWAKAAPSGGGGEETYDMELNVSLSGTPGSFVLSADKTFAEISAIATETGKSYTAKVVLGGTEYPMVTTRITDNPTKFDFVTDIRRVAPTYGITSDASAPDSLTWSVQKLSVTNENHWSYSVKNSGFYIAGKMTDIVS